MEAQENRMQSTEAINFFVVGVMLSEVISSRRRRKTQHEVLSVP